MVGGSLATHGWSFLCSWWGPTDPRSWFNRRSDAHARLTSPYPPDSLRSTWCASEVGHKFGPEPVRSRLARLPHGLRPLCPALHTLDILYLRRKAAGSNSPNPSSANERVIAESPAARMWLLADPRFPIAICVPDNRRLSQWHRGISSPLHSHPRRTGG